MELCSPPGASRFADQPLPFSGCLAEEGGGMLGRGACAVGWPHAPSPPPGCAGGGGRPPGCGPACHISMEGPGYRSFTGCRSQWARAMSMSDAAHLLHEREFKLQASVLARLTALAVESGVNPPYPWWRLCLSGVPPGVKAWTRSSHLHRVQQQFILDTHRGAPSEGAIGG